MRHFETKLNPNQNNVVGTSIKHDSAVAQVTGRAHYVDDTPVPADCLYAYPVMSTITCGRIQKIDTRVALNCPGVVKILSADDIPGKKDIGPIFPGDVLLAEQDISYHGQPILLVVATSYEVARKAARLVQVDYLKADPLLDIQQAIASKDWVRPPQTFVRGDIDQGFASAPHRLQGELSIGGQEHFYLEGQVALTAPTDDGGIFVKSSTQHPTEVQHLVAEVLGKPFNAVTVEMRRMGGGFGGKETQAAPWAVLAALATYHTGKACKVRLARADDFRLTGKRHPFFNTYDVAFDDNGIVKAVDMVLNGYCGYSPDLSDSIVDRAMFHADNSYFYENVRITGNRCRANTVSHTAYRGFGGPQGMIMAEAMMDDIARYLGKDPLDVRMANLYQPGRDVTPYHQPVEQFIVDDMMHRLMDQAHYHQRRKALRAFNTQSPVVKRGIALTPVKFGISFTAQHLNQAGALVHVYTDGSIHLTHGGTEMGQGLNIKVAQVVAQVFGVDVSQIGISATRTDKVPNTSPTAASSGSDLNGMAALDAATKIKQRLIDFLVTQHSVDAGDIQFINGKVTVGKQHFSFKEVANAAYMNRISLSANGYYSTPKIYFDAEKGAGRPFFYFSHGVALTEVELDTLTGENSITRVDILHDVGHSLNPAIDIGQIEGGFIQGMGWLTTEDLQWNAAGELTSFGPATYKIPAIGDTPAEFNVQLFDSENPEFTVFRSKAVGEPPFMLANSVWCALRDALASVTDYRFAPQLNTPATPERLLNAVTQAQQWKNQHHEEVNHAE
ncbi:MAG: xanthine dehydrogenase molybdopterin binding subunit [Reinekea sp.]|nr:xanthine dehydrogenase molybdopterin binding subunit [Reinekea sp.]